MFERRTRIAGLMGYDFESHYHFEPRFHVHDSVWYDPSDGWVNNPRMQWTLFLYHAPIRIQLRYRTDSAVLMVTKDVWCGVLFVPRVDPRHPRTMGFLSEDLNLAVLVVEV